MALTERELRQGLRWKRLLRASGMAGAAVMAIVAVTIGDLEAGVVAVGWGVSVALLSFRTGLLGRIGIGLVSAITLFFMLPAAITNVRADSPGGAVLLSAGLASISLSGVLSAMVTLIRGTTERYWARPWSVIGLSALLLIALLGSSVAASNGTNALPDVALVAENVAFSETELSAPAGEMTVGLANKDLFWHTFTIEELRVDLLVPVGASLTVTFDALPGNYQFICRIPGHPYAGMVGSLTVTG